MKRILVLIPFAALTLAAQDNALPAAAAKQWSTVSTNLVKAAEKMPEENYAFAPVAGVRTFGQLVGHVANGSYMYCSMAAGEKNPNAINIEKDKSSKADLVAALKAAVAYCDQVHAGMTDAKAMEKVKMRQTEIPRLIVLTTNTVHGNEHYGNMVTYMRIKGLVPPSSER